MQNAHALSSELHRLVKSLDKSHGPVVGQNGSVQAGPNHSHAARNWDVSLGFNKSSRGRKIWIRSYKYLSHSQAGETSPKFCFSKTHDSHTRWPERGLQKSSDAAKASLRKWAVVEFGFFK